MKKYIVEFTLVDGKVEEIELTIQQWSRNRAVSSHKVISEGNNNSQQMLFG